MKDNKLFLYIFISIIIHLVILLFFPLANKAGIAGENDTRDFGFIQLVEYEPITQTSQDVGNDEFSEDQVEEEENKETEDIEEEAEPDIEEENIDENVEEEASQDPSTEEENTTDDNSNEQEIEEVEDEEQIKEINNNENNEEIISSEDSDFEMNINEENKESETNEKSEEEVNDNEEDDSSTSENKDSNENTEEQEEKSAPPPPPTSGELIANTVTPQYPKDLVGESQRGIVEFVVEIDKTGKINNLNLTSSSGIDQIDRTARLAIERGWKFKSYNLSYKIPITVNFNINDQGNPEIDVNLGEVEFEEVND